MRKNTGLLSGLLFLVLLSASCTAAPTPAPNESVQEGSPTPAPTQTYTASPTITATPAPLPSITPSSTPLPLTHYTLLVIYDATAQFVQVEETLRYVNTTHTSLQELPFVVEANLRSCLKKAGYQPGKRVHLMCEKQNIPHRYD